MTDSGISSSTSAIGHFLYNTRLALNSCACDFSYHYPNLLAVGSYQLNEKSQKREGRISFFDYLSSSQILHPLCYISTSGIFDLQWHESHIGAATASGNVDLYHIAERPTSLEVSGEEAGDVKTTEMISMLPIYLKPNCSLSNEEDSGMALSLAWDSSGTSNRSRIAASFSSGALSVYDIDLVSGTEDGGCGKYKSERKWYCPNAHSFEAWICRFLKSDGNLLVSGSDDTRLKLWDIRLPPGRPASINRQHMSGVTVIESLNRWCKDGANYITVGSYDQTVSLIDMRKFTSRVSSVDVGGGVWRIRGRENDNKVAVAAMRGQFSILSVIPEKAETIEVVETYAGPHTSLAYGVSWLSPGKNDTCPNDDNILASVSFYDNALSIWKSHTNIHTQ